MKIGLKTILITFVLVANATLINAQQSSMNFVKNKKWKAILKEAKQTNKPIFVDAYTSWCGPCKMMDKQVFNQKKITDYFSKNFINVKMDMEKGEAIKLKSEWNIKAFPTFLYFNSNGEITHRVVGAHSSSDFIKYSKMALSKNENAKALQKRFDAGERSSAFMYSYLISLRLGYHKKLENKVAEDYLKSLSNKDLLKSKNWNIIKYFMNDPTTKEFQYLVNNKEKLQKTNNKDEVDKKLYNTINKQLQTWSYWYGNKPFKTDKEEKMLSFLQSSNYEKAPVLLGKLLANKYKREENHQQYLSTLDYIVKFNLVEKSSDIVSYANHVLKTFTSKTAWKKALTWLNIAEKKETRTEHKAVILMAKSNAFKKLGNKTEAKLTKLAANKADEEAEKAGTKIHTVPMMKMTSMKPKK